MSDRVFLSACRAALLTAAMLASPLLAAAPSVAGDSDASAAAAANSDGHGMVMGVGLVVGLPGTGDSSIDQGFVEQSIVGVLKRAGLDLWRGQIEPSRVAKVLITADLPANAADGARIVVHITAIGDAASLAGGTLLATPLRDENGKVYGVGQGAVEVDRSGALAAGQPQQNAAGTRDAVLALGAVIDARRPGQVAAD
jgi:flagellar P-ring protein FlgI